MTENRIHAPELPNNLEWFNTKEAIRLADLKGRVILLDFWSYCCINCMHIIPDLKYLENKYGDRLVVIGIHSPKFPNERVGAHVQKAINRNHIRHPVANDPLFQTWKSYGIRAWPSIIVIDPEGYVLGVMPGEGRRKQLDDLIQEQLRKVEAQELQDVPALPLHFSPEPESFLSFPGKILVSPKHLYISDSGHNRILEANHQGRVLRIFGSAGAGFLDGQGDQVSFDNPQGLALINGYLYVADAGNHAVRRINLQDGEVVTIAGNGQQGRYEALNTNHPVETRLNSPWELAYTDGSLFIAMAGQHQIWNMQLSTNTIDLFSGSGREDLQDGTAKNAAFAQPSGLALVEHSLYVADAETSAIRSVRLSDGKTTTVIGTGLFDFGDLDDFGTNARLQHPLGIAYDQVRHCLWIADTYNHKLKKLDVHTNEVSTVDTNTHLEEPAGISIYGDSLWIANTNAHEIQCLDLENSACRIVDIHE